MKRPSSSRYSAIPALILALGFCPQAQGVDNQENVKVAAASLVRSNRRSPREMKTFAEKLSTLSQDKKREIVEALAPFLKSERWEEQANAVYLLGYLGDAATPAVPDMIKAMDAKMSNVAWAVGPALAMIGAPAVPPLIAAFKAEPVTLSRRVYNLNNCVRAMGAKAAGVAPYIVPFLDNGHNTGAVAALEAIGPACLPAICKGFEQDQRGLVVVHAGYVFEKIGAIPSTAAIVSYLNGKCTALGKKNAVYALAKMKPAPGKAAVPVLCRVMAEGDGETLENAATALTAIGPYAAPDVLELASHKELSVRARVQKILRTYENDSTAAGASVKVMVNKLNNANDKEAAEAAATILKLAPGNVPAVAKMRELLTSKKSGEVTTALRALPKAEAGGKALVPELIRILRQGEVGDRVLAAEALGAIGPGAAVAVRPLIEAASISHPIMVTGREGFDLTGSVHQSAVIALGKIGPSASAALPLFCKMLKESAGSSHADVFNAIGSMGAAALPAIPDVLNCLKTNQSDREGALALLLKLGPTAKAATPQLQEIVESNSGDMRSVRLKAYQTLLAVEPDAAKTLKQTKVMMKDSDYRLQEAALATIVKTPSLAKDGEISAFLSKGLAGNNYALKQLCLAAIAEAGSSDDSMLPALIKDNIGSSYSQPQKDRAFAAIKKIDPSGDKTLPLLRKALDDPFQVRGAVQLLEYIGSAPCLELAKETRTRWKLK